MWPCDGAGTVAKMLREISDNPSAASLPNHTQVFLLTLFLGPKVTECSKMLERGMVRNHMHARLDARFDLYTNSRQNHCNQM